MFVQVIQGKATDGEALMGQLQRWADDLASGADGFLGSTAGVAADGTFVALARFESEEAARANSEREEQGQWWEETSKHLEDVTFRDCSEVETFLDGGSDGAGFVQVIQGRVKNRDRYKEIGSQLNDKLHEQRPEILGGYTAWDGDLATDVVYFASEHTAREGEGKVLPEEAQKLMDEWSMLTEDVTFIDLTDPWMCTPGSDEDSD